METERRSDRTEQLARVIFAGALTSLLIGCAMQGNNPPSPHHAHHPPHDHKFDDPDEWAARWNDPNRDIWQRPEEVIDIMEIRTGMTVADIGTGTGYFVPHLSEAVGDSGRVLALDISIKMIEYVKETNPSTKNLTNVQARVVLPDNPHLPGAGVDRILIVNTWHHIRDRIAYARTLSQSLKTDGRVIIVDYNLDAAEGPPQSLRMSPQQIVSELQAAGLAVQIVQESLPRHYVVVGRHNAHIAP